LSPAANIDTASTYMRNDEDKDPMISTYPNVSSSDATNFDQHVVYVEASSDLEVYVRNNK
ncbi:MAG: hypothetical protein QF704_17320, partial [Anaerolineales bacterium]|nr:hypothetical protein [Anaerolineales bacterium]